MEFRLPELGEGVYEAEFVEWHVRPGDVVQAGQSLAELLTDKASMDVPSPFAGTVEGLLVQPGQQVQVGAAILTYRGIGQPATVPASTATAATPPRRGTADGKQAERPTATTAVANTTAALPAVSTMIGRSGPACSVPASPSVRRMARSLGVDLVQVEGSGRGGRVLIDDLARHVNASVRAVTRPPAAEPALDLGVAGTRLKMHGLRRKVAEHMVQAKRTIPHYSYVDECNVTELVRLRDALKEHYGRRGVKLTYLAFAVKAVVAALQEVPLVNSTYDEATNEIVLHDEYHIGIATATHRGLVVPVVHHADRLDLADIAREIERLSAEARSGQAKLDDLRGGTFTVTSIGNIGGLISTPVINHPEVGILGIGKIVKRPVFDERGQILAADLVYLSFSFDHRIVDGAVGALFGNAVIQRLQQPALLLVTS